jgi:hypothetical protein
MPKVSTSIVIFPQAPDKPVPGEPCNGCGVCCLLEPCPLGVLLSGHRLGACQALVWQVDMAQYRCGAISSPAKVLTNRLPSFLHDVVPMLAWMLPRWARRWVAAGSGCDCDVRVERSSSAPEAPRPHH